MTVILWIIRKRAPGIVNRVFRRLQLVSGGFVAFTHGTNDAQKTMGIITLALISSGHLAAEPFEVPTWVIVSAATAMAAGTYAGGWRIIKTLGTARREARPAAGVRGADVDRGHSLDHGALRVPGLDDTHDLGSVLGAGASTRLVGGSLGRRREHRCGVGPHHPVRRPA